MKRITLLRSAEENRRDSARFYLMVTAEYVLRLREVIHIRMAMFATDFVLAQQCGAYLSGREHTDSLLPGLFGGYYFSGEGTT